MKNRRVIVTSRTRAFDRTSRRRLKRTYNVDTHSLHRGGIRIKSVEQAIRAAVRHHALQQTSRFFHERLLDFHVEQIHRVVISQFGEQIPSHVEIAAQAFHLVV